MGAAQFDGRPSDILQARLQESLRIYKASFAPRIYTIGAGAPGDRTTEARASRNYLISNGVKSAKVLAISKGRNTLESSKAYVEQMNKVKLSSVIIVTDPYHCYRAVKMAQDLSVSATCSPATTGPAALSNTSYRYLARETGAYLAYITVGRLGIKLSDRLISRGSK